MAQCSASAVAVKVGEGVVGASSDATDFILGGDFMPQNPYQLLHSWWCRDPDFHGPPGVDSR